MPALPAPTHASSPPRRDSDEDLDTQILHAEQRLIAREQNLRRHAHLLMQRVRHGVSRPKRFLWPAVGFVAAVVAGRAVFGGRRRALAHAAGPRRESQPRTSLQIPWVRLVGLAWPMVPASWRQRISPATASMVATLGLPLAERLFGSTGGPPLATMPQVDLGRYAGTWYEVARLPVLPEDRGAGQAELRYHRRRSGRIDLVERWLDADGELQEAVGAAEAAAGSAGARLKVSGWPAGLRWLPGAWSDRWILHVDKDYTEALVGSPGRDFLRLLSRTPQLAPDRVQALVDMARDNGFAVDRLRFTGPP